jgi:hypothetical protein
MIGRKLVLRLMADGALGGGAISALTLLDTMAPASPIGFTGASTSPAADLEAPGVAETAVAAGRKLYFIWLPWSRAKQKRILKKATGLIWTAHASYSRQSDGTVAHIGLGSYSPHRLPLTGRRFKT